jgi:uncharacterized protein YecA (UPF0149 family)
MLTSVMTTLGRNDPCHCGSGKKYKKCHLDADQRSRAAMRQPEADSNGDAASPSAFVDVKKLPHLLRQLSEKGPAKDRKEFSALLAKSEPLLDYMARREEIEDAGAELESHRAAFDEIARDEKRYADLARTVFAEECFAPLRFTASEVQSAFDHVGHPALMSPDEQTVNILRTAILHIADQERRSLLSMGLLTRLPEFVRAGRYREAWLVQCAALDTAEHPSESNAFLFQMFCFGYDAWAAKKRAKDEALLRELGFDVDRLRGMSLEELDAWMQSQTSDPAKTGALEAFFRENPHLREESVANLEAMERNSARLLEREDSRFLHVPSEEVQPWIALFNERFSQSDMFSARPDAAPSEESVRRMFEELALPLMREMAASIFTHDRIQQLVADVKKYRNELFAAGDKLAAEQAMGAITYLEREDSPGENSFLLTLCWRSLDSAIKASAPGDCQPPE